MCLVARDWSGVDTCCLSGKYWFNGWEAYWQGEKNTERYIERLWSCAELCWSHSAARWPMHHWREDRRNYVWCMAETVHTRIWSKHTMRWPMCAPLRRELDSTHYSRCDGNIDRRTPMHPGVRRLSLSLSLCLSASSPSHMRVILIHATHVMYAIRCRFRLGHLSFLGRNGSASLCAREQTTKQTTATFKNAGAEKGRPEQRRIHLNSVNRCVFQRQQII